MTEILAAARRLKDNRGDYRLAIPGVPDGLWSRDADTDAVAGAVIRQFEPQWEDKNWGRVWHRFYDEHVGESLLEVVAGQRCSMHYHVSRANVFISIDATVEIDRRGLLAWGRDKDGPLDPYRNPAETAVLGPGSVLAVAPMIWHLFKVRRPGRVVEVYYCPDGNPVRQDDIVRWDEGCALREGE